MVAGRTSEYETRKMCLAEGWKLCAYAQVCGSPRVYVPDGTDARDDGE